MNTLVIENIIGEYRYGFVENHSFNNNIKIHFIEKNWDNKNLSTVVFSAGLWEPAERALPLFDALDCHCISFSYRGRGNSDTPLSGYDLKHHISDFNSVIEGLKLEKFAIVAFSRGAGYACGYTEQNPEKITGMILVDHPPIHTSPQTGYADYWKNLVYLGHQLTDYMRPEALDGIEKEAREFMFWETLSKLDIPITLLAGTSKTSKIPSDLSPEDLNMYRSLIKNYNEIEFNYSGHMIVDEELGKYRQIVKEFVEQLN